MTVLARRRTMLATRPREVPVANDTDPRPIRHLGAIRALRGVVIWHIPSTSNPKDPRVLCGVLTGGTHWSSEAQADCPRCLRIEREAGR